MSMNIKSERVHTLAREVASRTGRSQTSAVEVALERYLADLDRESNYDEADKILKDLQRLMRESTAPPFDVEDLYDPETGLPA